jgi:hypothetical protein
MTAVCSLACAAAIAAATPALFGTMARGVHVRWAPDVTAKGREYLERKLGLTAPRDLGARSWSYLLLDASPAAVQTLVTHPSVEDTQYIDRITFAPAPESPRVRTGGRVGAAGRLLRPLSLGVAGVTGAFGLFCVTLAVVARLRPSALRDLHAPLVRAALEPRQAMTSAVGRLIAFLQRGVPIASAEAAGTFRVVFGVLVLTLVARNPVHAGMLDATLAPLLSQYPGVVDALSPWLLCSGVLFITGVATRASYAAFVTAFFLWATVATLRGGSHAISTLVLALVVLLPSRWGDARSVDALLRRRAGGAGSRPLGRNYGFSIWAPGFVLGVACAAAAWSKVKAGPVWIVNGTVKYHFISDAPRALVNWGQRLTENNDTAAIAASAFGVAVEALLITAAFSRSSRYRAALAVATLMLFTGFILFQGIFWPAWWVLFLSFLPWHRIGGGEYGIDTTPRLGALQVAAVVVVLTQQLLVSAANVERAPILSAYDMYSASYDSMEDYKRQTEGSAAPDTAR